jgi:hypothetical protein
LDEKDTILSIVSIISTPTAPLINWKGDSFLIASNLTHLPAGKYEQPIDSKSGALSIDLGVIRDTAPKYLKQPKISRR